MTPDLSGCGKVDLGDVRGDDQPGIESLPGEDHFHLLPGRILGLVQDDERAVQVLPLMKARGAISMMPLFHQPVGLVVLGEVEEGVVKRP